MALLKMPSPKNAFAGDFDGFGGADERDADAAVNEGRRAARAAVPEVLKF